MSPASDAAPVLVVGLGNLLLGDEGIGLHVVRAVGERAPPDRVATLDGGTAGFELLSWFAGRRRVVVVDALDAPAEPGTLFRIPGERLAGDLPWRASAHGSEVGALLNGALALTPAPEVVFFGVVPERCDRFDLEPSPLLRSRLASIAEAVLAEALRPLAA